jgi:putative flippase GtrA
MTEVIDRSGKPANAIAARVAPMMRFLAAGAVNTLLSIAVYQAALFFTGHAVAYGIAYVGGILFAYFAYARMCLT